MIDHLCLGYWSFSLHHIQSPYIASNNEEPKFFQALEVMVIMLDGDPLNIND